MSSLRQTTSISELYRVGKALEKRLGQLGIHTAQDVLFHFPFRYEDYRAIVPIKDIMTGVDLTIKGTVEVIANKRSPRKRTMIPEAVVRDATDQIDPGQPVRHSRQCVRRHRCD